MRRKFLFYCLELEGLWQHGRASQRERLGKGMKIKMIRLLALLAAALVSGLALPSPASGKANVASWNTRIQETVRLLRAGNATQARATIAPVIEEMTREINPGKNAAHAFGLALMLRSLAEAGSGNERLATWDWHVAQQLDAPLEQWDLREFGAAGEVLARHRLSNDPVPAAPTSKELEKSGEPKPTILTRGRQPNYLEKSRLRRWMGAIVLAARIDAEGLPTYPRIVQSSEEIAMVLSTCEYARELTFTPAQRDGRPIAAIWDLTVSYRLE